VAEEEEEEDPKVKEMVERLRELTSKAKDEVYHPLLASPEPPLEEPKSQKRAPPIVARDEPQEELMYLPEEEGLELTAQSHSFERSESKRDTSAEALALSLLAKPTSGEGTERRRQTRAYDLQWLVGDYEDETIQRVSMY